MSFRDELRADRLRYKFVGTRRSGLHVADGQQVHPRTAARIAGGADQAYSFGTRPFPQSALPPWVRQRLNTQWCAEVEAIERARHAPKSSCERVHTQRRQHGNGLQVRAADEARVRVAAQAKAMVGARAQGETREGGQMMAVVQEQAAVQPPPSGGVVLSPNEG